jgi:hypothetical protein
MTGFLYSASFTIKRIQIGESINTNLLFAFLFVAVVFAVVFWIINWMPVFMFGKLGDRNWEIAGISLFPLAIYYLLKILLYVMFPFKKLETNELKSEVFDPAMIQSGMPLYILDIVSIFVKVWIAVLLYHGVKAISQNQEGATKTVIGFAMISLATITLSMLF